MWKIYKEVRIEAAHRIPEHKGPCQFLHGHSYRVQVWVWGKTLQPPGFVLDFGDIAALVRQFDHKYLNECSPWQALPPTAEYIAQHLAQEVLRVGGERVRVRIWETPTSYAEYTQSRRDVL